MCDIFSVFLIYARVSNLLQFDFIPATVSSVQAKTLSYGESMFKRLSKNSTIEMYTLMLRKQYRMNKEILSFPNRYFYGNALVMVSLQYSCRYLKLRL